MVYMLTFTINIPQMLAYIPAPWILWVMTKNVAMSGSDANWIGHDWGNYPKMAECLSLVNYYNCYRFTIYRTERH